tara:strand:- start:8954 stop:9448 length:495 start_codon:yes stop_codon:yes gene_type:complete
MPSKSLKGTLKGRYNKFKKFLSSRKKLKFSGGAPSKNKSSNKESTKSSNRTMTKSPTLNDLHSLMTKLRKPEKDVTPPSPEGSMVANKSGNSIATLGSLDASYHSYSPLNDTRLQPNVDIEGVTQLLSDTSIKPDTSQHSFFPIQTEESDDGPISFGGRKTKKN